MDRNEDGIRLYLTFIYGKYLQALENNGCKLSTKRISSFKGLSTLVDGWRVGVEQYCKENDPEYVPGKLSPMHMHAYMALEMNRLYGDEIQEIYDAKNKEENK